MKKPTSAIVAKDQSAENLLAALLSLPIPPQPLIEHRVYYDALTCQCTLKSTEPLDGESILVTREEYDSIDFCPNFRVTTSGKIVPIKVDSLPTKLLQLQNTGFRTIHDNLIFRVDESYLGETDTWGVVSDDL